MENQPQIIPQAEIAKLSSLEDALLAKFKTPAQVLAEFPYQPESPPDAQLLDMRVSIIE
jgi:hypothetical protein